MQIQLTDSEILTIKKIFIQHIPNSQIYLFGSRVKGTAKQYSDLDVLIKDQNEIPLIVLSNLQEAFAESDLIFKVDLVDWHRITDEFQENIQDQLVKFGLS